MTTIDAPGPGSAQTEPIARPGPVNLLWYSLGGSLPKRHSSWVLHDVTCRTWLLRHFARTMLIVLPLFVAYVALAPASLGFRLLTGLTFSGGLIVFSLVTLLIDTDRRAVRAGYGAGLPAQIRTQLSTERQRLASSQRRERI
ncbi:MAG TPA: DUF5313 family protein, partial [Mycobacterium sp.]|nr:DUF5313 family protein [Mycobacterium sp.]